MHGLFCHAAWRILRLYRSVQSCCTIVPCLQHLYQMQFVILLQVPGHASIFVAGDCATRDWINHCVCIVFEMGWHFGMFHECTWGKDCAECSLFADGKYVYGLLGHNMLPCTTGKGCMHCLCSMSWLRACGLFRIGRHDCRNLLNNVWGWHNPRCVVSSDLSMKPRSNFQHAFGSGVAWFHDGFGLGKSRYSDDGCINYHPWFRLMCILLPCLVRPLFIWNWWWCEQIMDPHAMKFE